MFIRLSRNASEQIARLSVQLSSFEVQLYHLPSDMNLAHNFTRLRKSDENLDAQKWDKKKWPIQVKWSEGT